MLKILIRCFVFILVLPLVACSAQPADASFKAGRDYELITSDMGITAPQGPHKIKVIEFFSYGCPWCYRFEPYLETWLANKPNDVEFERVPVVFESGWDMLAKAYYTAHDLGIEAKMMPVLFKAIQDQNQDLSTEDAIEKLFVAQGVSKQSFESTFDFSPGIDAQMMRGDNLMRTYGVYEIPTIVVDGKYKTNVGMSGGDDKRFIQVVNYLIAKARQGGN